MKYTKYPELKAELKELAKEIKAAKIRRDNWWNYKHELPDYFQNQSQSVFMYRAARKSREFRHKHIAYCLLRGRSYEQIEQPHKYNKPDMIYVQMIMEEHGQQKAEFRTIQHKK
jgi:hypothetical protein